MANVYRDVMSLNLEEYQLFDPSLKVSPFEAITCILTLVWRAKWQFFYDAVDHDNQTVMDRAMINLRRLSSLNLCR